MKAKTIVKGTNVTIEIANTSEFSQLNYGERESQRLISAIAPAGAAKTNAVRWSSLADLVAPNRVEGLPLCARAS